MKKRVMLLGFLTVMFVGGCGNVYLRGEASTAAETSTMDAYLAVQKLSAGTPAPAGTPAWVSAYLEENFRQWRSFVRASRKDANWGPKLASETQAQGQEVSK